MGGDKAPEQNVKGALLAAKLDAAMRVVLVGDVDKIKDHLADQPSNIMLSHCAEVIGMDEHPVKAVRQKKNSSLVVAATMVKNGEADAFVSAGNTGAMVAAGLLVVGRTRGVERPAIGTVFPTRRGVSLILDVGANVSCKAENLLQFAEMGSIYLTHAWGVANPSIGLLNIGEESTKGNPLALRSHELLSGSSLNFYGNVEGRDIPEGTTDIVVCDGFTGNITLKLMEGLAGAIFQEIKDSVFSSLVGVIGATLLSRRFKALKHQLDPDRVGGSPLLGVDANAVVAHGSSSPRAMSGAIGAAARMARSQVSVHIGDELGKGL